MIDKNVLIMAITKYSNEIDNLYIENLLEELRQLSNSQEEFYEYRKLVIQLIVDDSNSETIIDDIINKNDLGIKKLFSGIEFNKKVIISKELSRNSLFGNDTFFDSTFNDGVIYKLKTLPLSTFNHATISNIHDLSDVEYLRDLNLSCKYNDCKVILKDIEYFGPRAFYNSTNTNGCKIEYTNSIDQFEHVFNESVNVWTLGQIASYNHLYEKFYPVHCIDGKYTFRELE